MSDGALDQLLATLSRDGRDFERLARWYMKSDPESVAEYREVWLWDEWPGRWGADKGIDLIVETHDGRIVAVQAKNYGAQHSITKRDVDSFLSESNRPAIAARLLIATTDRVAANGRDVMAEQEKPVSTCLLTRLRASPVQWPAAMSDLAPAPPARANPMPHQEEALAAIERWAATEARCGQILMACGTGKSLIGVWAADRLEARRVLVLAPTLELLRQLARDWTQHAATTRRVLHVSSDADQAEDDATRGDELGSIRTTDPVLIAERLRAADDLLVLCTYNSSGVLAEALARVPNAGFDLAIADEAHRCAGPAASTFKTVLHSEKIPARRRLFFTATPTVFSTHAKSMAKVRNVRVASMDDHELFGAVVHRLTFGDAIERGLLCRYQVAVIPIKDDEVHRLIEERRFVTADGDRTLLAGSLATQIACARAMRRYGCRRVVAFQPGITHSRRFAEHFPVAAALLPEDERPDGDLWCRHVDGSKMPLSERYRRIEQFKSVNDPTQYRLLSNVRLLAEGVDVPGIDAVAFVDTRRGQAQIIQAVGRAVRTAPGKEIGTIVLPIVLREDESIDAALARTEHRMVVDVLGALRSHDGDIGKALDTLRFGLGPETDPGTASGRFVIDAPIDVGEDFAAAVEIALANALSIAKPRPVRRQRAATEILIEAPRREQRHEPSAEEMFWIGESELEKATQWTLAPKAPQATAKGFPLGAWWEEAKRRWAAFELDDATKRSIANSVSWLAPDLAGTPQRTEMMRITEFTVPEQVAAQLGADGIYHSGSLSVALESGGDPGGIVDELHTIHDCVTHPAMSPEMRVVYLTVALRFLADAVAAANETPAPPFWHWTTQRRVAIEGFVYAVQLLRAGSAASPPALPLNHELCPEAHQIGCLAAEPLQGLIRRMRAYQFSANDRAVDRRVMLEEQLAPDERFDALAWNIYMLVRANGGDDELAASLAMTGPLSARKKVHADRLRSALARVAREDTQSRVVRPRTSRANAAA